MKSILPLKEGVLFATPSLMPLTTIKKTDALNPWNFFWN
jgi:hypothetical protein